MSTAHITYHLLIGVHLSIDHPSRAALDNRKGGEGYAKNEIITINFNMFEEKYNQRIFPKEVSEKGDDSSIWILPSSVWMSAPGSALWVTQCVHPSRSKKKFFQYCSKPLQTRQNGFFEKKKIKLILDRQKMSVGGFLKR